MARCEGCGLFAGVDLREPDEAVEVTGDEGSPVENINIQASFGRSQSSSRP